MATSTKTPPEVSEDPEPGEGAARPRQLDWQLVHPIREGQLDVAEQLYAELRDLEDAPGPLADADALRASELAYSLDSLGLTPCEKVGAPVVQDARDWKARLMVRYIEEEDCDLELDEYIEANRHLPDCARCPYRTPYTAQHLSPCEFDASGLLEVLQDPALSLDCEHDMEPSEMEGLAHRLEQAAATGQLDSVDESEPRDYVEKAALFLRFWAGQGFAVAAVASDGDESDDADDEELAAVLERLARDLDEDH